LDRTTIGSNFIVLKDWSQRKDKSLSVAAIQKELQGEFIQIQEGQVVCFNPPAISGLGTFGGFEFWIENRGDGGNEALEAMVKKFIGRASQSPVLSPLSTSAQFDNMQFFVDVDRFKAKALGVSVNDIFQALQTLVGSVFINNFNKFGRVYQVIVQANPAYRETIENLGDIYIRSSTNQMVPLKALIDMSYTSGPNLISRFNDYGAVQLFGEAKPGYSTQQAIHEVEAIAEELMQGSDFNFGWSGQAYQEIQAGGSSSIVLIAALIVVFLILAALYERWTVPMAVMMAIPFGAVGAFIAIYLKGISNDVYFQIGLVTLIALSAKNGILIVEFAMLQVQQGKGIKEAALEAAKLRFRAIIMTSLTFILGVLPLVMSRGAGAASRHSVGVGIFGGMIAATTLALLFVPFFFTLFYRKKNDPS
jgi:multidrug efflux pump subunit AcrB